MAQDTSCQPVTTFCCGCPLDLGIQIVLAIHLGVCFFYSYTTFSNVVLEQPTLGYHISPEAQAFNTGFALATLPFIISGWSGVKYHIEVHLRIYLYWLVLTFGLDLVFVAIKFYLQSCARLPEFLVGADGVGGSFACGAMRISSFVLLVLYLTLMGYCIFVVWSRCQQLQFSSSESDFAALVGTVKGVEPQHLSGLFGTGPRPSKPEAIEYASLASLPFGGGANIFGGRCHDTNFPPRTSLNAAA
uniref:Uncharacterized protein n=1 Tax=Alexandrium andersonii TaxID=327968 RepID=A0A7S2MNR8_9DINO